MNIYLVLVLSALVFSYVLDLVANRLNLRNLTEELPAEFEGYYDRDGYAKSQQYLGDNTRFSLVRSTVQTPVLIAFILAGGFNLADRFAGRFGDGQIVRGLVFAAVMLLLARLLSLPFSWYDTFVIEQRYGFNKTTPGTFVLDLVKELALTLILGGALFAAIIWFFLKTQHMAWVYCWGTVVVFEVFLLFIAPYVIMPLFNTFKPVEEGELRSAIEAYAAQQHFQIKGVYKMDGSRRTSKTNAFFTGFGKSRRIVLYDTLIAQHTVPELTAIVAHEMGHYKKKHIPRAILRSVGTTGITFFLLSFFIEKEGLFEAFRTTPSVYAGLVFFGFLYTPIAMVLSLVENSISRRQEYEADRFAVETTGDGAAMAEALKKLSVDNLANLTPHPLKVFLDYSHPPILDRIRAIQGTRP